VKNNFVYYLEKQDGVLLCGEGLLLLDTHIIKYRWL